MLTNLIKSIVKTKNLSLPYDSTLEDTFETMTRNDDGTVVLLREKKPLAIITERDVMSIIHNDIPLSEPAIKHSTEPVISLHYNRDIAYSLHLMIDNNIRRVVITDNNSEFYGVITLQGIIKELESDFYNESLKAFHLLRNHPELISLDADAILADALKLMLESKIGSLPIVQEGKLLGIITERDIVYIGKNKVSMQEKVLKHAEKKVYAVDGECFVEEIVETMIQRNFRRVIITDQKGIPIGILSNRDIFQHIEKNYTIFLENKIKHEKEILNYIPEIFIEVMSVNGENIIQWCNKKATDIFGEYLLDKPITNYIEEEVWKQVVEGIYIDSKVDTITIELGKGIYEISAYQLKPFNCRQIQLILKDVTQLEAINRTLTDRIKSETEKNMHHQQLLIHQSKLAEMGEMIGLIAHQWKQPLNNLGLFVQDLEDAYEYGEMNKSYLEQVVKNSMEQINFMSTTIDDFRNFFKPSKKASLFRIDDACKQVLSILSPQMTRNYIDIKLLMNHADENRILGMENEFKQVILNLLNNSKDAIIIRREKGELQDEEKGEISIVTEIQGEHLAMMISDNGGGIPEEVRGNIFEPYFSTKDDKIGTGIGLHMSKIIVEDKMGGSIQADNYEKGAVFTIMLPLSTE